MHKRVVILGSTGSIGSIGQSALDVVEAMASGDPDRDIGMFAELQLGIRFGGV